MSPTQPDVVAAPPPGPTSPPIADPVPDKSYILLNRTPWPIRVRHDDEVVLSLPPLSKRVVTGAVLAPFWAQTRRLRCRHMLKVREYRAEGFGGWLIVTFWVALAALLGVVAFDAIVHGTLVRPEAFLAAGVSGTAIAVVLGWSVERERARRARERGFDEAEGDVEFGVGGAFYDGNETVQRTKHAFVLLLALLIGAVMPALALFLATDMKDFLLLEGGLAVKDGMESRLVSRVVQAIYAGVLSLFPALLYFQFDRQRVGTIRGRWVRAIFRMDTDMHTLADIEATYGDELAEASSYSADSARYMGVRHSPILVATILVTLGWTLLVIRTDSFDFAGTTAVQEQAQIAEDAAARARDAAGDDGLDIDTRAAQAEAAAQDAAEAEAKAERLAELSTTGSTAQAPPTTAVDTDPNEGSIDDTAAAAAAAADSADDSRSEVVQPFFQLLVPQPNSTVTAFLGAYFFAMYLVLRGYFRGDLRPKVYNQITTRLVTVVILGYLLTALYTGASEKAGLMTVAFFAGVIPRTVLRRVGLGITSFLPVETDAQAHAFSWRRALDKAVGSPRALTQVDGIDIYEAALLESEGITDVASLAKTDLVTMMVNTRLPVERLVDWADQAVLILLLDEGEDDELDTRIVGLRRASVRTATDLLAAVDQPAMRTLVAGALGPGDQGRALLDWLVLAIGNEPSISRIRRWRASDLGPDGLCREIRVDVGRPAAEPVPVAVPEDETFATTA